MARPTESDNLNASLYAYEREKLLDFNEFLLTMPHIFSHVNVEIRHNNKVPNLSFDTNIYVRLIGTKTFCDQVKCQSNLPRGKSCDEKSEPTVFKSGNTDILACESSCFNLYEQSKDKDGNFYKAPLTMYNARQQCCTLHTDAAFRLGMDDYIRTDNHPTKRVDTIGTGFDLDSNPYIDEEGNETYHFKINKYYCDDFKYEFVDGKCKPSLAETIFGIAATENLYKAVQYGLRALNTGVGFEDVNIPNLPPIVTEKPPNLDAWLSNINTSATFFNADLKLSDLGITPDKSHLFFTTAYGWPGQLVEPLLIYASPSSGYKNVDFSYGKNLLPQFQLDSYGRRFYDEYELLGSYEVIRRLNREFYSRLPTDGTVDVNKVYEFFNGIFAMFNLDTIIEKLSSAEFYAEFVATFVGEFAALLKKLVKYAEKTFVKVTRTMITMAQHTLIHAFTSSIGITSIRYASIFAKIASSSLKAISVVGLIFDIIGLVDIALIGFDLFGQKNLYDEKFVDGYSKMDLHTLQMAFGYKTIEFSPVFFMDQYRQNVGRKTKVASSPNVMLLHDYTGLTYSIASSEVDVNARDSNVFKWRASYALGLKVNSNGDEITWDDVIDMSEFNDMVDNVFKKTPPSYANYLTSLKSIAPRRQLITVSLSFTILLTTISILFESTILFVISMLFAIISFTFTTTPL